MTKFLVGALWFVVTTAFIFMGNVVKANDEKAQSEHTNIRKEFHAADEKIQEKISQDIKEIKKDQTLLLVQQSKMLVILKELKISAAESVEDD